MTEGKYNFWGSVIVGITGAFRWAYSVKLWVAWIVPIALCGLALWLLVKQERGLQEAAKELQTIVRNQSKRKAFQQALVRVVERAALIGLVVLFLWSKASQWHIEYVASHLSSGAEEFWKAQCLGLKVSELIDDKFQVGKEFYPQSSKLTPQTQSQVRQTALHELEQKGIIKDKFWIRKSQTSDAFDSTSTPFGKHLCTYYLTVKHPKRAPEPSKIQ